MLSKFLLGNDKNVVQRLIHLPKQDTSYVPAYAPSKSCIWNLALKPRQAGDFWFTSIKVLKGVKSLTRCRHGFSHLNEQRFRFKFYCL